MVLLGKIVDVRGEAWTSMPDAAKAQVRQSLWQAFLDEQEKEMVHKLSHAIAKTSRGWPKLVEALLQFLNSTPDPARMVGVFFLFEQMAEYSDELQGNPTQLLGVFQAALKADDNVPMPVRTAALKALLSLLTNLEVRAGLARLATHAPATKGGKGSPGEGLLPLGEVALGSLNKVWQACGQGQLSPEDVQGVLELLTDTVEMASKFFTPFLPALLELMMSVGSTPVPTNDADAATVVMGLKCASVEVLLMCCKECPGTVRKTSGFAKAFLTLCMGLCATAAAGEDMNSWAVKLQFTPDGEDPESTDDTENTQSVAAGAIYRLMGLLGGKSMLPIAMEVVPEWLGAAGDECWAQRRVSLMVVQALVSYCPKHIKASFGQMLKTAVDFTGDSHPRVAAEAIHLVNTLCEKFPELAAQGTHLQATLPALHAVIGDGKRLVRLRGIAVDTLAVVLTACHERIPPSAVAPFMKPIFDALVLCMAGNMPPQLQEATLDALAALATLAQEGFGAHYADVMRELKGIVSRSSPLATGQAGSLRDKAVECVGILGNAVGKAAFAADAKEVMDMLVGQLVGATPGQVSFERLGAATGTVCEAMGEHFFPYLAVLGPLLVQTTQMDLGYSVEDVDEEEEEGATAHANGVVTTVVDLRGMGGKKRITVNSYAMQEVQAALDTLDKYARVLGAKFATAAEELLPFLNRLYTCPHAEVRTSAALCAGAGFDCVVEAVKLGQRTAAQAQPLLLDILPKLVDQYDKEQHAECRQYVAQAMRDMLRACAESGGVDDATGMYRVPVVKLGPMECVAMASKTRDNMVTCLMRRAEVEEQFKEDEEMDDNDYAALMEEVAGEVELMGTLTDCMGYLIKSERANFVPSFDEHVVPLVKAFLQGSRPATLMTNAVCLFDDMIEYGSPAAHKYLNDFMPLLSGALERAEGRAPPAEGEEDDEEELAVLRQACVYGTSFSPSLFCRVLLHPPTYPLIYLPTHRHHPGVQARPGVPGQGPGPLRAPPPPHLPPPATQPQRRSPPLRHRKHGLRPFLHLPRRPFRQPPTARPAHCRGGGREDPPPFSGRAPGPLPERNALDRGRAGGPDSAPSAHPHAGFGRGVLRRVSPPCPRLGQGLCRDPGQGQARGGAGGGSLGLVGGARRCPGKKDTHPPTHLPFIHAPTHPPTSTQVLATAFQQFHTKVPAEAWTAAWAGVSEETKVALQPIVAGLAN